MPHSSMLLALALCAALAAPATAAQDSATPVPSDSAASDSAASDSTAQSKPERRGGLLGGLRRVTSNKTVQGVAKGVACNAVPGAAVAATAAGSDVCPAGGLGGGGAAGIVGGALGGAIGATAAPQAPGGVVPNGGALPSMTGMPSMAGMPTMAGMQVNEEAAAKCMGLTLQEYRDAANLNPDAATKARAQLVREKLEQGRAAPGDMAACASVMQGPAVPTTGPR